MDAVVSRLALRRADLREDGRRVRQSRLRRRGDPLLSSPLRLLGGRPGASRHRAPLAGAAQDRGADDDLHGGHDGVGPAPNRTIRRRNTCLDSRRVLPRIGHNVPQEDAIPHVDYEIGDALRAAGTFVVRLFGLPGQSQSRHRVRSGTPSRRLRQRATGMRSPTPRTEVRNSLGSLDRVEIADTASYEAGVRALLFDRLDLHGNVWRADNSNEIRGIPPGTEFESLGKSRREGGGLDARVLYRTGHARIRLLVLARGTAADAGHSGREPAAGHPGFRAPDRSRNRHSAPGASRQNHSCSTADLLLRKEEPQHHRDRSAANDTSASPSARYTSTATATGSTSEASPIRGPARESRRFCLVRGSAFGRTRLQCRHRTVVPVLTRLNVDSASIRLAV